MPTDEIANMWVQFKFSKTKNTAQINRLKLISKLGIIRGPTYIKFKLKMMDLEKELFTLDISRGLEVRLPPTLD
jgi:hypothetical protein